VEQEAKIDSPMAEASIHCKGGTLAKLPLHVLGAFPDFSLLVFLLYDVI
jgi:hypothetical protein